MTTTLLQQALDALTDYERHTGTVLDNIRAHLAQPPATSADYAMGYAEGFNDACKPAQPAPAPAHLMHELDEILSNAIVSRTDSEIVDAASAALKTAWNTSPPAPVPKPDHFRQKTLR